MYGRCQSRACAIFRRHFDRIDRFFSFQALAGEGGYGEPRPPIFVERQPYYPAYPARIPLNYGIRRTYSGDYIGPGATNVSEEFSFVCYRAIVTIVLPALHKGFHFLYFSSSHH